MQFSNGSNNYYNFEVMKTTYGISVYLETILLFLLVVTKSQVTLITTKVYWLHY